MPVIPVTVKGGLPVMADVWFSGPDWQGEYDAGIDALYWRIDRKGKLPKQGKQVSAAFMEKLIKADPYWEGHALEEANDYLMYRDEEAAEARRDAKEEETKLARLFP